MSHRPERLAAVARMLQPLLLDSLALQADRIADELAHELGLVAWERERLIGHIQGQLMALREQRFGRPGGAPVRIVERRLQPLESLVPTWQMLRRGRQVHLESEPGTIPQLLHLMRAMAAMVGEDDLTVADAGANTDPRHREWRRAGVVGAERRVALVQEDADPELAAYLLARACLRRTGFDPRSIHRVVVIGRTERLERHLRRLWFGVVMGAVDDERAFAGPVTEVEADSFLASERSWRTVPGVEVLCGAGRLEHVAHDRRRPAFLAPALLRLTAGRSSASLEDPPAEERGSSVGSPPLTGPLLLLHRCAEAEQGEALLEEIAGPGDARLRIGPRPRGVRLGAMDRQIHGALLLERLPPGLPDPRP
jgi:hypothetical protein